MNLKYKIVFGIFAAALTVAGLAFDYGLMKIFYVSFVIVLISSAALVVVGKE